MRSESRIAASSSTTKIRDFGMRRVLAVFDPDRLELPLVDLGRVDVEGQDVARPCGPGHPPELAYRVDRLAIDFEQDVPALHVGVERGAHGLDARYQHALHAARQIEALDRGAVDVADR